MDDINDFFDFSKPFKRTVVSGGYLNGRCLPDDNSRTEKIPKREVIGKEYSTNLAAAQEMGILDEMYDGIPDSSKLAGTSKSFMESMEDSDDMDVDDIDVESKPKDDIYEKYNFTKKLHSDLPIFDTREKIVELIKSNRIVVLEGDTGCGKTTQIPQFILDDAYEKREYCNVICTQPRRIAAISIAQRVCDERNWKLGTIVGYQVGLHKEINLDTRLLYCTTGVLLQKLIKSKSLASYTHIILDEVHERDQDMDFLLIVIKKLIRNAPGTKIILMSATINTKAFSEYFKSIKGKTLVPAPILKVDTRRLYDIKVFYIEDLKPITNHDFRIDFDTAGIGEPLYKIVLKLVIQLEKIDQSDTEQALSHKPSILIFLPGLNEIDNMERVLEGLNTFNAVQLKSFVIRLHSMISPDEQQKAFRKPAPGYRKIILATNIAESSITVPDVKYVIDFCLTKNLVTDTSTNLTSLQLQWASKSNCKQRSGRAGRVMNGRVYRLVTRNFYENHMPDQSSPEITRCPLENIILKAKMLDMGAPHNILGLALDPPNLSDIRNTILILKEVGALHPTVGEGKYDVDDGDLTFIGRVMAQLPIDIHVTRLIIFGYLFSILEETVIIAAGLNVKSIFDNPYQNQLSAYVSKLIWSNGSGSDLFAMINAYSMWKSKYEQGQFQNVNAEAAWCRRFYINPRSMKEMHYLIFELHSRLKFLGIKEITGPSRVNWLDHEKTIALMVAISGAFYPNYFVRTTIDQYEYERSAYQTLCSRNPCNTVYFTGFDNKYIGELYVKSIKDIFKKASITYKNMEVDFEEGSQKVFVKFNAVDEYVSVNSLRLSLPGRVLPEVYKAVKLRQIRLPTSIKVMPPRDAALYATEKNLGQIVNGKFEFYKEDIKAAELIVLPSVFTRFERGIISYIENCGKFWFRPEQVKNQLTDIIKELNDSKSLYKFTNDTEVSRGMLVAAKYKGKYFRSKILRREEESKSTYNIQFKVIFIDYGDELSINFCNLYGITQTSQNSVLVDLPPRAFQCYLAGISPSAINCTSGHWINESTQFFREAVRQEYEKNEQIVLEIYSVVNGISATFIQIGTGVINDVLVVKNLAQYCEENYMSKMDNDLRTRKQQEQRYKNFEYFYKNDDDERAFLEDYIRQCDYHGRKRLNIEPPPDNKCTMKLNLRGPLSPLETTCYSATRIGAYKTVRVERDSINSVLLNADPQDNHERLIVAATVSESVEKDTITARQTTLMPNIKGFAPLMALIFCPKAEIRRNNSKTKFSSIICGLGPQENNSREPLFPEHDIILNLNVDITLSDIETINQIRFCMDTILRTDPGDNVPKASHIERSDYVGKIKGFLIKLLEKDRQYIELEANSNSVNWNQVDMNDLRGTKNIYGNRAIFPLHDCMLLYNEPYEHVENLRKNCELLYEHKKMNATIGDIKCELCGQKLNGIMQLRIHLLSRLHKDREKQINFKDK